MKKIVFVLSIFLFANVVCFGQTQLKMNMDAQKAYEKADAVMIETYKQLSKKLTDLKQKQLLLESQRAWIKYKEALARHLQISMIKARCNQWYIHNV